MKHPLKHTWTLWYLGNNRQKTWGENLTDVISFDTIEDFWCTYNHILLARDLRPGCDYSIFKKGIRPMWEDDANKHGGRWIINLGKHQRMKELDEFWLDTLLCLIGEAFDDHGSDICGAVVSIRHKGDRIGIWTANTNNVESLMTIGRKLKTRLNCGRDMALVYESHKSCSSKVGSKTLNMYTL